VQSSQTWGFGHMGIVISPHKQKCIFFFINSNFSTFEVYNIANVMEPIIDNYTDIIIPYKIQLNNSCILTIDT